MFILVALVCGLAPGGSAETADARKTLLMHFMPWYITPHVRDQWGGHWTGFPPRHNPEALNADGLPDIWSHYHPLIGLYDSSNPHVLECQLLQMKLAGVDGVIADWYGLSDLPDYPSTHEATQALFKAAARFDMKFVACFEDRTLKRLIHEQRLAPEGTTTHLRDTFLWMQDQWFNASHYLRIDGRPLLLNFGPIHVTDPQPWREALDALSPRPALFALHHLWRRIDADGGFTWVHAKVWQGGPGPEVVRLRLTEVFNRASEDPRRVIVSAAAGFNDVYVKSHPDLDHRDGETLREALRTSIEGPWPIIQLVTWNDYGEGTMIEPTHQFGYTFLEVIQQERRRELGVRFPFIADDLRLPARLLKLRQTPDAPQEQLDAIAELLNAGHCAQARKLLDELEQPRQPGPR